MADFPGSKMRWLSGAFLAFALLMLVLGQTLLVNSLRGRAFIYYWLACFVVTGLAAIVAIIDFFSVRRRARLQQKEIIEKVFKEIIETKNDRPDRSRRH